MSCPHLANGVCQIASELAGVPAPTHDPACRHCARCDPPQAINETTVFLAALAASKADRHDTAAALVAEYSRWFRGVTDASERLQAIEAGSGVGSQIWRLLGSFGVRHTPTCPCLGLAERWNSWGVAGCRLARAEIIERLQTARQEYGWVRSILAAARAASQAASDLAAGRRQWLNPLDPYGSLVDEAIRRAAEAKCSTASTA